jgi:hypothetical protein
MSVRRHFALLVKLLICAAFMHSHIRRLGAARRGRSPQLLKRRTPQDTGHDHGWKVLGSRLAAVLLLAAAALGLVAPAANAVPTKKLDDYLAPMWTTVLETPDPQNPFGRGGDAFECIDIGGRTVAPFGPDGAESCTVKPGTKILVVASSFECSTIPRDDGGSGLTEPQLRACARDKDVPEAPTVTIDGKSVTVTEVETPALHPVLPADNIFGVPPETYLSVAHGWVALLHPLTPGMHTIIVDNLGPGVDPITTRIIVEPGH